MLAAPAIAFPRRKFLAGAVAIALAARAESQTLAFRLTIARKYQTAACTSGYLAVNGDIIAYTLELPWRGNAPLISSIPAGEYPGILRYDHADAWRIELRGVPGRTHVQIHTGNTPDDTEGCILVGSSLNADLCGVTNSASAYRALRTAFYGTPDPISTPDKQISVAITQ